MKPFLSVLSFATLTVAANAQCLVASGTSIIGTFTPIVGLPANDEGVAPIQPLGFTIDMNGTLYDHCYIGTNGMVELVVGPGAPTTWFNTAGPVKSLAQLRGQPGQNPMFCPWSDDIAVADVLLDTSIPGELTITWVDATAYLQSDSFDFQCTLTSVSATYSYGLDDYTEAFPLQSNVLIGASYGDAAGNGTEPEATFTLFGNTGSVGVVYELLSTLTGEIPTPDILDTSILILINSGGFVHTLTCGTPPTPPAVHTPSGDGCYPINEPGEVYQVFPNPTTAEAALENTALVYTPNADEGYTISSDTGTFRSTAGASALSLGDNQQLTLFLPTPFNWRGVNPESTLVVAANGYIADQGTNFTFPYDVENEFGSQDADAIVAWGNNLNPSGGGTSFEFDAGSGMFYITFEDVPENSGGGGDVTFQYQLELAAGICTVVYGDIFDSVPTTGTDPVGIGFSIANAPGVRPSIDVTTDLPASCFGVEVIVPGVVLTADGPAISTATTGTTVTYSVDAASAPDFAPSTAPGLKVGVLVASFLPVTGGIDLGTLFAGSPWNCNAFLGSLDAFLAFPVTAPFDVSIAYPAGVPPLTELVFQAAFLLDASDALWPTSSAGLVGNDFLQVSNALVNRISDN